MKTLTAILLALTINIASATENYAMPENGILRIEQPGQIVTVAFAGKLNGTIPAREVLRSDEFKRPSKPKASNGVMAAGVKTWASVLSGYESYTYFIRVRPIDGVLTCEKYVFPKLAKNFESAARYVLTAPCN